MNKKRVYLFGNGFADGKANMKNLLGGKGANLAEMSLIGIPVPPGFTITTKVCTEYNQLGKNAVIELIKPEIAIAIKKIEEITNTKFGDRNNPCLVSVRSGARVSMPGMMDTILNLGLNDDAVNGIAEKSKNERFAWDSYRRFIQMYGDVVLRMKPESKLEIDPFEKIIDKIKKTRKIKLDTELSIIDLQKLVTEFKAIIKKQTGEKFPDSPWTQLWKAICAVFDSWMNERAILYRQMYHIPNEWGTAVNVQAMVFGNMGKNSATGVAFSRDSATGENIFNGEYLIDAQGEDVVAGTRTPQQITIEGSKKWAIQQGVSEEERKTKYLSLEETMPKCAKELFKIQEKLENYFKDMQDLEFTIQDGKLWILQTRNGKRTGAAMIKIAIDLLRQGIIDEKTALSRQEPEKLDELLHPIFNKKALIYAKAITKGLPASPGAATGKIVFHADEAEEWVKKGEKVILCRIETSPEDLRGMTVSEGIMTARGGMTSHAAVVARGMGKCCVASANDIQINYKTKTIAINNKILKEGDWISLDGSTGLVYADKIETQEAELSDYFNEIMHLADKYARLKIRTNADTSQDASIARKFGAQGIGLCRTEHMFFEGDKIFAMREMILAKEKNGRQIALDKLLPLQRSDFIEIFKAMEGLPITIRLLDPPLHEFVPHDEKGQREIAQIMGISYEEIHNRVESLLEQNPMLGLRGCRLGNLYPEITEMQIRAILEAALILKANGIKTYPEIMVPLTGILYEFLAQKEIIDNTAKIVFEEKKDKINYKVGTMIEIPRAALTAHRIATAADFFSFGTNDLTQMTFGYSRDDVSKFLPMYLNKGILKEDPFAVLDQKGVGQLVELAIKRGREVKKKLKCGICGEHGGEPKTITYCEKIKLDYVSCSPFRVPIARLAAAKAFIKLNK